MTNYIGFPDTEISIGVGNHIFVCSILNAGKLTDMEISFGFQDI